MAGLVQKLANRVRRAWRAVVGEGQLRAPVELDGMIGTCVCEFPAEEEFIADWNALIEATPHATGFHRPAWQQAVYTTLCKPGRLRLITVTDAEKLLAVVPLSQRDDGLLESLGPSVSDYLDPLVHPEREPAIWRLLLKILAELRSTDRPGVTFHCVRDDNPARKLLPELAGAGGFAYSELPSDPTPVLALPATWDDYLGTLDAHERKETRRKINKALTKGTARMVRCAGDPQTIAAALQSAFALMEQAPGEKGEAIRKTVRPLLEKAAPAMIAAGHLHLTTLLINQAPAAVILQFPHAGGPMLYNCGFDAAQKEYSPGVALTAMSIQQAIEGGANVYDLLRGQEPYKYRLGAVDRPCWMMNLKRTG